METIVEILFILLVTYFVINKLYKSSDNLSKEDRIVEIDSHIKERESLINKHSNFFDKLLKYPLSQEQVSYC